VDLRFKKIMIFIVVILLLGMTLFETLKQLIDPDISIWGSHIVAIVFSTITVALTAYFALKMYDRINRALRLETARRETVEKQLLEARAGLEKTMHEFQKTQERVKLLSGLLPICVTCEKIHEDRGKWETLEKYIEKHPEAAFSRTICDQCVRIITEESESKGEKG